MVCLEWTILEKRCEERARSGIAYVPQGRGIFAQLTVEENLLAGAWYLSKWSNRSPHADNPQPFALAAYNAGPTKAREWAKDTNSSTEFIERIDYPVTKQYVQTILEVQVEFHKRFDKYPKTNQKN